MIWYTGIILYIYIYILLIYYYYYLYLCVICTHVGIDIHRHIPDDDIQHCCMFAVTDTYSMHHPIPEVRSLWRFSWLVYWTYFLSTTEIPTGRNQQNQCSRWSMLLIVISLNYPWSSHYWQDYSGQEFYLSNHCCFNEPWFSQYHNRAWAINHSQPLVSDYSILSLPLTTINHYSPLAITDRYWPVYPVLSNQMYLISTFLL